MKKLVKVKLINWHLFSNITVHIQNNALLSGENGAGKSTFLDAIQYVLTGGKAKFNTAANTKAKRDLEGYVRCKLGTENRAYLRDHDVVSHIALEFLDEELMESLIIGVVIEVNKNGRIYEHFYHLASCSIDDRLFIMDQIILGYTAFKKNLIENAINYHFCDTKEQTRTTFLNALEIKNLKYIELIPKALAFRPIDELNKFVFDFLLNEKKVNLDEIRQNVRSYHEFETLVQTLKEKEMELNQIVYHKTVIQNCENQLKITNKLFDFIYYESLCLTRKAIQKEIHELKHHLLLKHEKESKIDIKIKEIENELKSIQNSLNKDDSFHYLKDLENEFDQKNARLKELIDQVSDLHEIIFSECQLAQTIHLEVEENELLKGCKKETFMNKEYLRKLKVYYEKLKDKFMVQLIELGKEIKALKQEEEQYLSSIDQLKQNQFNFDRPVLRLKTLIEIELSKKYKKQIKVHVLCEVISINDESWRNACEGYLNTQRFDLIIEPHYFDDALHIYEDFKFKERIYGVGLVNTQKLAIYQEVMDGSLASKISSDNPYALQYVNMLLNKVTCCEDVTELKNHKTAITKTCMVYQNYTVRQIKEEVYAKPFIGLNALKVQLQLALKQMDQIKGKLIEYQRKVKDINFYYERLKNSQIDYIYHKVDSIQLVEELRQELNDLNHKIKSLHVGHDLLNLQEEYNKKKELLSHLEEDKRQFLLDEGKLMGEIDVKIQKEKELEEKSEAFKINLDAFNEKEFNDLYQQFDYELTSVEKYCQKMHKECEALLNKTKIELVTCMNQYNHKYHIGLDARIEAIEEYEKELNKIKNYQLVEYEQKAKDSRLQCEIAFKEQFIYQMRENVLNAQDELTHLNEALMNKKFGGDEYEFIYKPSSDFLKYYQLIMGDEVDQIQNLFVEVIDDPKRLVMQELFNQLMIEKNDEQTEAMITRFTDYRNYMSYDIKIHHPNGETTIFSKVSREKSGGETQTPFYVVIAASFEQLLQNKSNYANPACFVMFDEAFNNMDESRIQAMMEFYEHLNIQLMIAVPPQRMETIISYVNTTLVVMKDKEQSFIETFSYVKE